MVGKGADTKSSRIFQQCYLKCCRLQNLTPLSAIANGNGKVLDFCVDRIKYPDWPAILNALSCDLSLHSVSIRCRQQVKSVLEHIDCERLAKTVSKRAVVLTNFVLSNLIEALAQLLTNTTLLTSLLLEGIPLKIPYLNPLCEAVITNSSLQHLYLPRCLIGDAGCLAICKAMKGLPSILTLDLSGCELTMQGAGYIAELIKYQKIHRYSENWVHTLRYRLPELDAMAGLRRLSLCSNPELGNFGINMLLETLADDLWIKALDVQNCGATEQTAASVLHMLKSNTTIVVCDLRDNDIPCESLSKVRAALKVNEGRGMGGQYSWLTTPYCGSTSDAKSSKSIASRNSLKEKSVTTTRIMSNKHVSKATVVKKDKDYSENLEEQLQEEISHRQQLEELNLQLVDQMKLLKQQQIRMWTNAGTSSGSEQSFQASYRSGDMSFSSSSGSTSSVPIDQNTLSYIQQAFKDIYAFIKNNQCNGQCAYEAPKEEKDVDQLLDIKEVDSEDAEPREMHVNIMPKKVQSSHTRTKTMDNHKLNNKTTKSAHLLGELQLKDSMERKPEMIEKQIGDTKNAHMEDQGQMDEMSAQLKTKRSNSYCSIMGDSSETLVCPKEDAQAFCSMLGINPREALYSSSSDEESS